MAYKDADLYNRSEGETNSDNTQTLQINGQTAVDLPNESFVRDADISREGSDLVLDGPDGTLVIKGYFSATQSPNLIAPNGALLNPDLVNSFITSGNQYAQNASMNDASPIGSVEEMNGSASVTHVDGTTEQLSIGAPIYQSDVIETGDGAAVNITFIDESSFAISEETRLAIDEFVFDPSSQGGTQNFSVLKGIFVYTSGMIGRDDPDDVSIDTPVGSIGIRGTIIAGDVNSGEITVVEGAIVLRDIGGNEMTLASQFETGRFSGDLGIVNLGQKTANDVVEKFTTISNVSPNLFSSINDAALDNAAPNNETPVDAKSTPDTNIESPTNNTQEFDANGATDQDGDSEVDGTVDENMALPQGTDKEGALLQENQTPELTKTATYDTQNINPTAINIAKAMGMMGMDGTQTMVRMTTMSMTNDQTAISADSLLKSVTTEQNTLTKASIIETSMLDLAITQTSPDALRNLLLAKKLIAGKVPTIFKTLGPDVIDFASIAPDDFYAAGEGSQWQYNFRPEFDASATSFTLSAATISALNSLQAVGVISTKSFSSATGTLTLNFENDFSGFIADGANQTISLEVSATNTTGTSAYGIFEFDIFNDDTAAVVNWNALFPSVSDVSGANLVFNSPGNTSSSDVYVGRTATTDNITVFLNGGADNVNIGSDGYDVTNSTINLGSGNNQVFIDDAANNINNTIIGGNDKDLFDIRDVQNTFHGMGGDDTFKLNITTSDVIDKLNNLSSDILIDGGTSAFRALATYKSGTQTASGRGDTLKLTGTGAIDFTNIDDSFIKSMERLELGTGNQTVTLGYEDVIQMTDVRNTLLIRAGSGDNITFDDFVGRGFVLKDSLSLDDTDGLGTLTTGDDTPFNIYSNGDVTLIIEDGGASTNAVAAFA